MSNLNKKTSTLIQYGIIVIISLALLFFVIYKASVTSFTHDESFTYLRYVHSSFMHIISFKNAFTNNHILNSILMKYFEALLGSSELVLRLPNIIAFAFYLVFSFLLLKKTSAPLLIPFFLLSVFNPYLLDFFGLARGYGLSIGLMVASLFFLINYCLHEKNKSDLIFFNAGALLASLANFTLLNYYAAALISFNLIIFLKNSGHNYKASFVKHNRINFIAVTISAVILFEPIRKLMKTKGLDFGGAQITETLHSQVQNFLYGVNIQSVNQVGSTILALILLTNLFIILSHLLKKDALFFAQQNGLIIVNSLTLLILIESIVQHFLIGNDYFIGRFSLFLHPLFVFNAFYLFAYLYSTRYRVVVLITSILIIPLVSWNLARSLNTQWYPDWKYDMNTKNMLTDLRQTVELSGQNEQQTHLGICWLFEPTINFYRVVKKMDWLAPVDREGIKENDNYIYTFNDSIKPNEARYYLTKINYQTTETSLYENLKEDRR